MATQQHGKALSDEKGLAGPNQGGGSRRESEEKPCFPSQGQEEQPTGYFKDSFASHIGHTSREPACRLQ